MPTILLVEDNIMFRETLKFILASRFPDIQIVETGDGRMALKEIEDKTPELIVMDIKLPHANGLDLTKRIKMDHPMTKIIIVSTYDSLEYEEAAAECGADFFVSKQASSDDIISVIGQFLKKNNMHEKGVIHQGFL
ncbi:MAG: response regulator transcription factor [Deltaproteobacteria bacterium]|nr:response regulator transcription factor [Deltaproteobacteria bacterium]